MNFVALQRERYQVLRVPLYANSVYLMANSALGAGLGFVFWMVVTRLYTAEDVGLASALLSAASLLAFAASLGLGMGLTRFLAAAGPGASTLINSCLTLSALAGMVTSAIFLLGLPLWSPTLVFARDSAVFALAFAAYVVICALSMLLQGAFVGLRRAGFVLAKGVLFGVLKIVAAVAFAALFKVFGIVGSWALALACAVGVGLVFFLPRVLAGYRPVPELQKQAIQTLVGFSLANYVAEGLWSAPSWLLPLLVVNTLGGEANAYFYMSWGLAALPFAIPGAIAMSLFAEGSHHEEFLARDIRRSLKLIGLLLLPAVLLMLVIGDKLLLLFGREYSAQGTRLLWVLAPSALPVAVNVVYLAIARVQKRLRDIVLVAGAVCLATLALSYALVPSLGIMGAGVGWLGGQTVVALAVFGRIASLLISESAVAAGAARPR